MNKISENGEIIRSTSFRTVSRKQVSVQPAGKSKVIIYDFVNTYIQGASKTPEDYRVIKKPKKVDEYDIRKVVAERCKGCDLKSIVARIEKTGDIGLLNQRNVAYGDARLIPSTRGDALQKGVDGANFLDKLSAREKEEMIAMAKDPKKFAEFIEKSTKKEVKEEIKQPVVETGEKGVVNNG